MLAALTPGAEQQFPVEGLPADEVKQMNSSIFSFADEPTAPQPKSGGLQLICHTPVKACRRSEKPFFFEAFLSAKVLLES